MPATTQMQSHHDTIFAVASGAGRSGVAVVRLSGPLADQTLARLTANALPRERFAVIRSLLDTLTGDRIDTALVLRFKAPHSYTGEDVVEFQVHGGRAVTAALLAALARLPGLRLAEAGEFTRRAVENGRLDLTQAEGIADLVNAETEAQRRVALRQLDGRLAALYEDWRSRLVRGAAWIEASIDFADEEIPVDSLHQARLSFAAVRGEIRAHLNDGRRGEILRDGFHVAVIGPPNAGKSSLVNALAQRDIAIVSDIAGTTRDVLEVKLDLKGFAVILADTAGLREPADVIEREGVRRAWARAASSELRLLVLDGSLPAPGNLAASLEGGDGHRPVFTVWNKCDLVRERDRAGVWVSAKTGEGLQDLIDLLAEQAGQSLEIGEAPVLTRQRHRQALEEAERALGAGFAAGQPELVAENVRLALRAIGRITGRVDLDELLDVVFRDFCIGK